MVTLFLILIAVVVFLCVFLNNLSSRIGIPTLLAFIVLGILFGNNGVIPLQFEDRDFAKDICTVALIFIMFYGGFGTRWKSAKPVVVEAGLLASAGVIITAALTGLFCHFALHWAWTESFLLGAVVGSTDAASVFSILRSKKLGLKNNTAQILEVESGSNDPCAYMLTALMLSIMHGSATGWGIAWMLFAQIFFGAGCGFLIAKLAELAMENINIKGDGFDSLFIFAVAIAAYAIPDLIGGNGYLSVYIVGIALGNCSINNKKSLVNFFDGLTGLMQVLVFFLLGLLAEPALLYKSILPALAIFVFMLAVSRPLAVTGLLLPFRKYPLRQHVLISFSGLRGAASIVFAIMAITSGVTLANDLFNIVFCLVLISIALQGSLIPFAAKKLDMLDPNANVMKTFNDYSEGNELQFGTVDVRPGGSWDGKMIRDLNLPDNMLVALVLRGNERMIAKGHVALQAGDKAIMVTKPFADTETFLIEKKIKPGSRRIGHPIKDFTGDGLILLIRRNGTDIIPHGSTVLLEGDGLVLLRTRR